MIHHIWTLIGKKLSGEATPEELRELEELLQQNGAERYPVRLLEELWKSQHLAKLNKELENKWAAFETKLNIAEEEESAETTTVAAVEESAPKRKVIRLIRITSWTVAASLIFGAIWFLIPRRAESARVSQIISPKNGLSKIQLPDGTKVWLNSGSKLTYDANSYGTEFRKVSLTGEGFFDVVKDPQHPFIVTTSTISIRVLGTEFNVRSYANDVTSEAALVRGRIELTVLKNPEKKIILKASEKLTVFNNEQTAPATPSPDNSASETDEAPMIALSRIHQAKMDTLPSEALWIDNKLAFDGEDFESIAEKLERRYNIKIVIENDDLKKLRFTGRFQDEPINKALDALRTSVDFHYKTKNNQIEIY
jgi:ferric-dicitrate binding protein FerR (iron transport regulator)